MNSLKQQFDADTFRSTVAQDSLKKDFARLKNDLKDLRGIASEELQNQRNQSVSEILKNFEELKYIHQLLSYHITNQAYVLSGRVPGTWSIQYLTGRLQEVIPARWIRAVGKEKVSTDLIIERLQGLLSEINSLSGANIRFVERNKTSLELQRIVFQTVDYMFKHHLITEDQFKDFFQMPKTLKYAARNMIATYELRYRTESFYPKYPDHNSSSGTFIHLIFGSCSKSLLIYNSSYQQIRRDDLVLSIFECESHFDSLVKNVHPSILRGKEQENHKNPKLTYDLIQDTWKRQEVGIKIICFLYLDFIQENYENRFLLLDPTDQVFGIKFHLASESFQFLEELSRIHYYVDWVRDQFSIPDVQQKNTRKHLEDFKLIRSYVRIIFHKQLSTQG
ncbi:hypothetical protein PSHT_08528 [Puccinia striiformis]|uniref:Uncharacterized protein n=1 Tax=Puccinia striiformis TaxID=27350 RepID=A0A2S4VNZ0_9BASI|nr:hypothetical protein PSHT_08528 [Puccinia striiformis]